MLGTLVIAGLGCALLRSNPAKRRRRVRRNPKRGSLPRVEWKGLIYTVRNRSTLLPDFAKMDSLGVALWLTKHTIARGRSRGNNLAGLGGIISIKSNPKKAKRRGRNPVLHSAWLVTQPKGSKALVRTDCGALVSECDDVTPFREEANCKRCAAAVAAKGKNPRSRRNPVVSVKRSKDFHVIGTYDVALSDGTTVQISRDGGSGGGGWWYVEWPKLHFVDRFVGFTKAEALGYVEQKVAQLRQKTKTNPHRRAKRK